MAEELATRLEAQLREALERVKALEAAAGATAAAAAAVAASATPPAAAGAISG